MDSSKLLHDLKESNLKMKILLQMISESIKSGHNLEFDEQVKQLIEEAEKTKFLSDLLK